MPFLSNCHFYIVILKRVLSEGKFHFGHSLLLFTHLHFIAFTTKNKLNLKTDRMLESHKD